MIVRKHRYEKFLEYRKPNSPLVKKFKKKRGAAKYSAQGTSDPSTRPHHMLRLRVAVGLVLKSFLEFSISVPMASPASCVGFVSFALFPYSRGCRHDTVF